LGASRRDIPSEVVHPGAAVADPFSTPGTPARTLETVHMSGYLPQRDADLDTWALNFSSLITAAPATYGLAPPDAVAIATAYNTWHNAYLAASNPSTRTQATVATKNLQKANLLSVVRGYAATIRANRAVSDASKINLGLNVRDTTPTPVPPPATRPVLAIARMTQGAMEVRATDEATPNRRARPNGAAGLLLFRAIGPSPVNDPEQATFLTFVGKPEVQSTFSPADNGKIATYFARWTNSKGEVGPWSQGVSGSIAA
jgi:hypothetical protein